jgi:penicillin-binding protein 1A
VGQAQPLVAGQSAQRAIDARNAFIMHTLLQDVVRYGTAARAMQLGRSDLGGKTGTTNDFIDAWFAGYQPGLVAIAWIGYDNPRSLGRNETGSQAALPIWMGYIAKALKGTPEQTISQPEGIVTASIDPESGLRVAGGKPEYFYQEFVPIEQSVERQSSAERPSEEVRNQVF